MFLESVCRVQALRHILLSALAVCPSCSSNLHAELFGASPSPGSTIDMLSKKFLMPLLAGLFTSQLFPPSVLAHHQYESTEPRLGAVASEASECSTIGIDLLKVGGTAADALVGTVICVGVIGMYHSGKENLEI